jgi:proline iminopeptidase
MTPDEFTNQEFFLDVGDGHQIYVHDWGNAQAKTPIVYLHGGPGNGCDNRDKRYFDPQTQRVIFHDQRGAGKSLPSGSLEHNTTDNLVNDLEMLAKRLKLDKFIIVGGSWGSTLALAYGIAHPQRVAGMVLNGIFTGTKAEIDWVDKGGWRDFFPEVWQEYEQSVPSAHKEDPGSYHYKQAFGDDVEAAKRSAYAYIKMELALLKLDEKYLPEDYEKFEPHGALIEMHYLSNNCFLTANYILNNASKLTMPVYLLTGRYDMVCPPRTSYELSQALPQGHLIWTINGHLRQHEAKNIQSLLLDKIIEAA